MSRIAIIGKDGIGTAHICSVVRTGNEFIGYFDVDERPIHKGYAIINTWGDIKESVILPTEPKRYDSITALVEDNPDLIIIACPTNFHKFYLDLIGENFYKGKVLCEKPIGRLTSYNRYHYTLHIGYEWIYHPTLEYISVHSVKEVHNHKPNWVNSFEDTVWDLAGHCLSILKPTEPLSYISKVDEKVYRVDYGSKHIVFGYGLNYDLTLDDPVTIVNNNVILRWNDLFDWQLLDILKGTKSNIDWTINKQIKEIINYNNGEFKW